MNTQNAFEYFTKQKTLDTEKAVSLSYKAACEGIVLLENKRKALPLKKDEKVAFFGRMQKYYIMLGTGSGGRVCPPFTTNIFDSLKENGVLLDKTVEEFYDSFVEQNPYDEQGGWSHPSFQKEAVLKDNEALVASAASENETALYVITRTAGEDKDLPAGKGGYLLTDTEK
ncbi:MAG: glycoside hydrolase family 3 C-terminal domain-containing protein, partial [Clostridiales bacterium]|nr:glycoside hydrolase family 3 C-terminal domain-containing protein [Candidatus Coliplasma equi]